MVVNCNAWLPCHFLVWDYHGIFLPHAVQRSTFCLLLVKCQAHCSEVSRVAPPWWCSRKSQVIKACLPVTIHVTLYTHMTGQQYLDVANQYTLLSYYLPIPAHGICFAACHTGSNITDRNSGPTAYRESSQSGTCILATHYAQWHQCGPGVAVACLLLTAVQKNQCSKLRHTLIAAFAY
jgi:hypothetical protein